MYVDSASLLPTVPLDELEGAVNTSVLIQHFTTPEAETCRDLKGIRSSH